MALTIHHDCLGGHQRPHRTLPAAAALLQERPDALAAAAFLKERPDARVILVGIEDAIRADLSAARLETDARVRVQHASEVVGMDEAPASALRTKRDSSMRVAIDLVKAGDAQACVS